MTKSEAIHRAALRKHRHKGNYIATHEALLAEAEYLQRTKRKWMPMYQLAALSFAALIIIGFRRAGQIIKGWFA